MDNISLIAYKSNSSSYTGKEATSIWLGIWEYKFLRYIFEKGLTMFRLSDIDIDIDARRKHDVAKRLMLRGFIEKLGYNLYRVAIDIARILGVAKIRDTRYDVDRAKEKSNKRGKEAHGTRVFVGGGANNGNGFGGGGSGGGSLANQGSLGSSVELFFDNVRGYISRVYCYRDRCSKDLVYVNGDRDRTLSWWQVNSLYERVTYSEIGYRVFGGDPFDVLDGKIVIYSNVLDLRRFGKPSIRVEYRPPRNYVKRNGLVSTVRMSFYEMLKAWRALTKAILYQASQNMDYLKMFVEVFRSIAGMKILCSM